MISKEEIQALLHSTENFRVERTVSTTNMDKFCEAICAFSNDLPDSRQKGYLLIGAHDDGRLSGLKVDDALLKKISGIRSDGNILPLPVMTVERVEFPDGDLLVAEVSPSLGLFQSVYLTGFKVTVRSIRSKRGPEMRDL